MPQQLSAFDGQEHEQPSAEHPEGRKVVFDDEPESDVRTLPDGRFDGRGEWGYSSLQDDAAWSMEAMTHNQLAMWMLYQGPVTVRAFADKTTEVYGKPSFKLRARIADLRQTPQAPPIVTDEEPEETEWYIPKAETE